MNPHGDCNFLHELHELLTSLRGEPRVHTCTAGELRMLCKHCRCPANALAMDLSPAEDDASPNLDTAKAQQKPYVFRIRA